MAEVPILPPREADGSSQSSSNRWGWGVWAEPTGDTKLLTIPKHKNRPGTSTAGRRWQQLGLLQLLTERRMMLDGQLGSAALMAYHSVVHGSAHTAPHGSLTQSNVLLFPPLFYTALHNNGQNT